MATDLLTDVGDLLDNNWEPDNTGSRTPIINKIFDVKRFDFSLEGSRDGIFLYEDSHVAIDAALGGGAKKKSNIITIDIRTTFSRDQAILIRNEVERIIVDNEIAPINGYDVADIIDLQDLSDKIIKIWRFVLKLRLERFNVAF